MVRDAVAHLLLRTGALDAVLRVRAWARTPLLATLTHHHLGEPDGSYPFDPAVVDATPAQFRRRVELLARRFTVIGIDELCRALEGAPLPPNPALITFDDGYRSCRDVAVPILREVGVRAVFFVATSFVEERRLYWWDRVAWIVGRARVPRAALAYPEPRSVDLRAPGALPGLLAIVKDTPGLDLERFLAELGRAAEVGWDDALERRLADELIMDWDDVRALRDAGMDVESHSRRHRVLESLDPAVLADDLAGSRADLERQLGRRVRAIAYPVGRRVTHLPHVRAAVEAAGYALGFTNASGCTDLSGAVDRFDLRRIAADRAMSDAMVLGQMAIPRLGYASAPPPASVKAMTSAG